MKVNWRADPSLWKSPIHNQNVYGGIADLICHSPIDKGLGWEARRATVCDGLASVEKSNPGVSIAIRTSVLYHSIWQVKDQPCTETVRVDWSNKLVESGVNQVTVLIPLREVAHLSAECVVKVSSTPITPAEVRACLVRSVAVYSSELVIKSVESTGSDSMLATRLRGARKLSLRQALDALRWRSAVERPEGVENPVSGYESVYASVYHCGGVVVGEPVPTGGGLVPADDDPWKENGGGVQLDHWPDATDLPRRVRR